jgi:hypothetical protein
MDLIFNVPPDSASSDSLLHRDFSRWARRFRMYRDTAPMARGEVPEGTLPAAYVLFDIRPLDLRVPLNVALLEHAPFPDSVLRSVFVVAQENCARWSCASISWVTVTHSPDGWRPGQFIAMLLR